MQKFREYVYCDLDRMNLYINQIAELSKIETSNSYEKTTGVEGGFKFPVVNAGTTLNEIQTKNYSINQNPMENFINWSCNEKNAINYDGEELKIDDKDKLIVFSGKMTMPEMSENMELLNSFARNSSLFDMVPISDDDRRKMQFIKESDNIPILLELDSDYLFNFNLKRESILGNVDDFLDNIDDEVTVIGRIDKIYNVDEQIEIYDLIKEVFKLNRAVRRKMDKDSLKDSIIFENGPLVKITPIILYK